MPKIFVLPCVGGYLFLTRDLYWRQDKYFLGQIPEIYFSALSVKRSFSWPRPRQWRRRSGDCDRNGWRSQLNGTIYFHCTMGMWRFLDIVVHQSTIVLINIYHLIPTVLRRTIYVAHIQIHAIKITKQRTFPDEGRCRMKRLVGFGKRWSGAHHHARAGA